MPAMTGEEGMMMPFSGKAKHGWIASSMLTLHTLTCNDGSPSASCASGHLGRYRRFLPRLQQRRCTQPALLIVTPGRHLSCANFDEICSFESPLSGPRHPINAPFQLQDFAQKIRDKKDV